MGSPPRPPGAAGWRFPARKNTKRYKMGVKIRVAVTCPHCNDKDVGSNPAATRNEKWTWEAPTEDSPIVRQDLSGRPAM